MEKIRIKFTFLIVLCGLIGVAVFAQNEEYKITFDAAGGNLKSPVRKLTDGKIPELEWPADPQRDGFLFEGWFTGKDGSGTEFTQSSPVTNDMTVYAKWISIIDYIHDTVTDTRKTINSLDITVAEMKESLEYLNKELTNLKNREADVIRVLIVTQGVFALFGIALVVLNIFSLNAARKKIPAIIQEKTKELIKKQEDTEQSLNEKYNSIISLISCFSNAESSPFISAQDNNSARIESAIYAICDDIHSIKQDIFHLTEDKRIARGIEGGYLDPVAEFNNWAANPANPLPKAFYYIEGDMRIRAPRELKESAAADVKWITNREGAKKYLLPNPNSFNQVTDILELYAMDQSKLKSKGQNRIRIITPCAMANNGFVNMPGELDIL
ncbi:MAG: hypothetical protein Pg6C_19040 [Treponemataceae bacterium]|nr:MAG: hypothetical protein Pg6C_18670 [Treponemataceae bacterium]GMO53003.1 MAG: hypothetical protein Pg6C_19040 [Treponemataceae bacterium]